MQIALAHFLPSLQELQVCSHIYRILLDIAFNSAKSVSLTSICDFMQALLEQLEGVTVNLLAQLGALCAEQLRKATILQGVPVETPSKTMWHTNYRPDQRVQLLPAVHHCCFILCARHTCNHRYSGVGDLSGHHAAPGLHPHAQHSPRARLCNASPVSNPSLMTLLHQAICYTCPARYWTSKNTSSTQS